MSKFVPLFLDLKDLTWTQQPTNLLSRRRILVNDSEILVRQPIVGYLLMFIRLLLSYVLCVDSELSIHLWDSIFLDISLCLVLLLLLLYYLCVTLASYQLTVDLYY
jgi:hypothetical protein